MVLRIVENPIKVINLYGIVKSERDKSEDETIISTKFLKTELEDVSTDEDLIINLNSPGGDVFEGITIFNMLKRHKGKVTIYVVEQACSIASVIAMAGDTINMSDNSFMMIHCASTMIVGEPQELREMAETLDKIDDIICNSYYDKVKISKFNIKDMMKEETWLNAEDCKKYGFIDNITTDKKISACTDHKKINKYRNAPSTLKSNNSSYYL